MEKTALMKRKTRRKEIALSPHGKSINQSIFIISLPYKKNIYRIIKKQEEVVRCLSFKHVVTRVDNQKKSISESPSANLM
jgi:hypothetical protein